MQPAVGRFQQQAPGRPSGTVPGAWPSPWGCQACKVGGCRPRWEGTPRVHSETASDVREEAGGGGSRYKTSGLRRVLGEVSPEITCVYVQPGLAWTTQVRERAE